MSGVAPRIHHEFWRPPAAPDDAASVAMNPADLTHVCAGCRTEFMLGAKYCYACGKARQVNVVNDHGWIRYFEFHNIKDALGLPTPSLIAFLLGIGCFLAAISLGMIYTVRNFADFQALQLWRMEWLLGAVASFVAGMLLKGTRT